MKEENSGCLASMRVMLCAWEVEERRRRRKERSKVAVSGREISIAAAVDRGDNFWVVEQSGVYEFISSGVPAWQ